MRVAATSPSSSLAEVFHSRFVQPANVALADSFRLAGKQDDSLRATWQQLTARFNPTAYVPRPNSIARVMASGAALVRAGGAFAADPVAGVDTGYFPSSEALVGAVVLTLMGVAGLVWARTRRASHDESNPLSRRQNPETIKPRYGRKLNRDVTERPDPIRVQDLTESLQTALIAAGYKPEDILLDPHDVNSHSTGPHITVSEISGIYYTLCPPQGGVIPEYVQYSSARNPDGLYVVVVTQEEMYDLGNFEMITHYILFDSAAGIAFDVTSDVQQAPLLSAVAPGNMLPPKGIDQFRNFLAGRVPLGWALSGQWPSSGSSFAGEHPRISFSELSGPETQAIREAMLNLKQTTDAREASLEALRQAAKSSQGVRDSVAITLQGSPNPGQSD